MAAESGRARKGPHPSKVHPPGSTIMKESRPSSETGALVGEKAVEVQVPKVKTANSSYL